MKNWKAVTIGFVAGAMAMTVTPAFGAVYKSVSAMLMHDATFKINDQLAVSESNQPVLNYNNYTYVPTRFVAEKLGCTVTFDPTTRQVVIKSPEQKEKVVYIEKPVEKEKIIYVDKNDGSSTSGNEVYSKMPVTRSMTNYDLMLRSVSLPDEDATSPARTTVYLNLKNIKAERVEMVQDTALLTLDEKEYQLTIRDNLMENNRLRDKKLKKDESEDGFLVFDGSNRDYKTGTLKVDVHAWNNGEYKTETVTFNFKS